VTKLQRENQKLLSSDCWRHFRTLHVPPTRLHPSRSAAPFCWWQHLEQTPPELWTNWHQSPGRNDAPKNTVVEIIHCWWNVCHRH